MKRRTKAALALLGLLALAAAVLGSRIARHFEHDAGLRLELGRTRLVRLAPETRARLASLSEPVFVTYFASPADQMPSSMRQVERRVTDLLEALRAESPGRFDFQIVDPDTQPELAGFAARRRVAPYRVKSVTRDAYSEETVWSSLSIALGDRPEALLNGIGPESLPRLQATLVSWLDQLQEPRRARILLAGPDGFEELEDMLAERGEVIRVYPERGESLSDADLFVWIQPRGASDEELASLDRFVEGGGSVFLAFQRLVLGPQSLVPVEGGAESSSPALVVSPNEGAAAVLEHFGLEPVRGLVLDETCDSVSFEGKDARAPFVVRCIAPNQDFHVFKGQPNGTLLFAAPTPLALDDARLRSRGWNAAVLATTSDTTSIVDEPAQAPLAFSEMEQALRAEENAVPKQPLLVALSHDDPWRGRVVVAGSTTPFENGLLHREHVAHPRLVDTILDELLSSERLVIANARIERPDPLPPLSLGERFVARALGVFAIPLLWALSALIAGGRGARAQLAARQRRALRPALGLALPFVLAALTGFHPWRIDATAEDRNLIGPETRSIAARAGELGLIEVELVFSNRSELPPFHRSAHPRLEALLAELERAGAKLDVRRIVPTDLGPEGRRLLESRGIRSHESATADGDVTTVRRFFAAVALHRSGAEEVLAFPDERSFETLEYRLALALWILNGGKKPHVAFASDAPRLSAAEAYEEYQQRGLFAPKGSDVYSLAREVLRGAQVRVSHVNPRDPKLPEDIDVLVWLQPRRSIEPMIDAFVRFLVAGGRAMLAAQHFNIESLQHRGTDFELVYWPQPQSPDVEYLYFPELGIQLVREVLFDELATPITTETKIRGRHAGRDFERQTSALPFLIRAAAANFDSSALATRNLGDQAFVWANHLAWDETRLASLGIRARTLITTSERSWTFPWKAGWIPEEVLAGPPAGSDGRPAFRGRLPLAVLFEGAFPAPAKPLVMPFNAPATSDAQAGGDPAPEESQAPDSEHPVTEHAAAAEAATAWPESEPGQLLFLGCSELFKNQRILDPDFRGDQLLWNAVLSLALEPDLARIATRRVALGGFGYVPPERRLFLRLAVVGSGPLLLLIVGLVLARSRT